jgi:phosphatidylglycerophosphatase A
MFRTYPRLATLVSSGFGSGYSARAPGTCGSAVALLVWLGFSYLGALQNSIAQIALAGCTILVGTVAVRACVSREPAHSDPQWIVIDEWAGLFVALIGLAPANWGLVASAFVLFRLLDATKIGPIGLAERLPGALGIMADDIVAGLIAALTSYLLRLASGRRIQQARDSQAHRERPAFGSPASYTGSQLCFLLCLQDAPLPT